MHKTISFQKPSQLIIALIAVYIFLINPTHIYAQYLCVDHKYTGSIETGSPLYPFKTIQQAINAAANGTAIRVAGGSYQEALLIADKQLHLLGGYPGAAPSHYAGGGSGNFENRDHQEWVTTIISTSTMIPVVEFRFQCSGSSIDGFVITSGYRGIHLDSDFTWPAHENIQIRNNIIENNGWETLDDLTGAGIRLVGNHHVIEHNIIRHNRGGRGGGLSSNGNDILIAHNEFTYNIANSDHGGGLYIGGTATLMYNLIAHNTVGWMTGYGWGGGVIFIESGNGQNTSSYNQYIQNHAPTYGGGVFVDEASTLYMDHDLVIKNTTSSASHGGAGIAVDRRWDGSPSYLFMDLCTVADNMSTQMTAGNGIYIDINAFATVTNSIFWSNGGDFYITSGSGLSIDYSICEDPVSGLELIHENPLFADNSTNDYHLRSMEGRYQNGEWIMDSQQSPGIDAGDPQSSYNLEPSPHGNRINLGRYGNTEEASKSYNQVLEAIFIRTEATSSESNIILFWDWILDQTVIYTIEHSTNLGLFTPLASGECSMSGKNHYTHVSPGNGIHYYRLKIAEKDKISYSPIWSIHHQIGSWFISPNPARDILQIQTNNLTGTTFEIIDLYGRVISQKSIDGANGFLEIDHIPAGNYFIRDVLHPFKNIQPFIKK